MEFFHDVNIDWMGKAKYFVALSLTSSGRRLGSSDTPQRRDFATASISAAALWSTSASPAPPPIDKIRKGSQNAGLPNSTIQQISDISDPTSKNDVVIGLEQKGQGDRVARRRQADDSGRAAQDFRHATPAGKPDFNSLRPRLSPPISRRRILFRSESMPAIATTSWRKGSSTRATRITAASSRISTS